jgi:hypothetical protein
MRAFREIFARGYSCGVLMAARGRAYAITMTHASEAHLRYCNNSAQSTPQATYDVAKQKKR